jgi:hypothetical protein
MSSHQHNPFVLLCDRGASEDSGACYGMMLMYSGNHKTEVEPDQFDGVRAVMGLNDERFRWELTPGTSFHTPEVILTYADGLTQLSHNYHRIIQNNVVRGKYKLSHRPVLVNNWEATYFDFTGEKLLEIAEKDELHLVILLTAYYGLCRSEVLGLKWSAIDFTDKKIAIRHKVLEESGEIHGYDVMKTKSSYRTLPLIPVVEEALRNQISFRDEMKKAFRKGYCTDYEEYICTDALGRLYRPDYVSEHFALLLKNNGLRHIRFHELRHSCASLLLAKKVPMKMIQEWLGHSDISTTSNIYSHLDAESKLESADIIGAALSS